MWAIVAALVWITYARLPASDFYNVTGTGFGAGAARVLVLLGWPISLAAVALLAAAADRLLSWPHSTAARRAVIGASAASVVLCMTIAWPGVIKPVEPRRKAVQPARRLRRRHRRGGDSGGACAAPARARGWRSGCGDRVAIALLAVMGVAALPWIFANVGVYVGDVPGLSQVFMSKKILPEPGHPHLHAVHLGNHEGLDGWLLAATALGLRRALADDARRPDSGRCWPATWPCCSSMA